VGCLVRSNLIEDGYITDGSPALYPTAVPGQTAGYPTSQGFEINNGLSLAISHIDIRNNSGWSFIANRSPRDYHITCQNAYCPGFSYTRNTTLPFGDNRLCGKQQPTICGDPYECNMSTAPWLHPAGGNCAGEQTNEACGCAHDRTSPNFMGLACLALNIGVFSDSLSITFSYLAPFWG
jgi:hypothetical protein